MKIEYGNDVVMMTKRKSVTFSPMCRFRLLGDRFQPFADPATSAEFR